jgi:hypothetical protein
MNYRLVGNGRRRDRRISKIENLRELEGNYLELTMASMMRLRAVTDRARPEILRALDRVYRLGQTDERDVSFPEICLDRAAE